MVPDLIKEETLKEMANSNDLYGANLNGYTLEVLRNKQVERSTVIDQIIFFSTTRGVIYQPLFLMNS